MKIWLRIFTLLLVMLCSIKGKAQDKKIDREKIGIEIYGFIMADVGYNFNTIDPDWFDVMRPTKLPSFHNEFGRPGGVYFSVRQTRLGVGSTIGTPIGDLKTRFDFDLFGFGDDAGQTTFHLINAFAELRGFGAGQTASVFMDQDVVPFTLDYWGPCSRTFNFNIQLRYMSYQSERQRFAIAIERPKATADGGAYESHIEIENVQPQFLAPNITAHYRRMLPWGHIQTGGLLKWMKWNDMTGGDSTDLSGQDIGWGINLSALVRVKKLFTLKMQTVYGEGIQNYFADAPADVGLESSDDPNKLFEGKALPIWGIYCFTEWNWSKAFSSTIGYATEIVWNSDLQEPDAFHKGQYALVNLRYEPFKNFIAGIEYQFGRRDNNSDNFHSTANKIQLSFKYNFSSGDLVK